MLANAGQKGLLVTKWLGLKEGGFQVTQGPVILTSPPQHRGSLVVHDRADSGPLPYCQC